VAIHACTVADRVCPGNDWPQPVSKMIAAAAVANREFAMKTSPQYLGDK
jgi:hypothetical protein